MLLHIITNVTAEKKNHTYCTFSFIRCLYQHWLHEKNTIFWIPPMQCLTVPRPPPGIIELSSYHQGVLRTLSATACIQVASPLLLWLDYTLMRGMGTSGNVDYRCWPSYSQQGCVLSVHSAKEAAYICNSHSQCNSFTLTGQTTWTGQ